MIVLGDRVVRHVVLLFVVLLFVGFLLYPVCRGSRIEMLVGMFRRMGL